MSIPSSIWRMFPLHIHVSNIILLSISLTVSLQCRPSKGHKRGHCWCVDKYGQPLPRYEGKEQSQVHCYNQEKKWEIQERLKENRRGRKIPSEWYESTVKRGKGRFLKAVPYFWAPHLCTGAGTHQVTFTHQGSRERGQAGRGWSALFYFYYSPMRAPFGVHQLKKCLYYPMGFITF